jgi:hypothetical protein
VARVIDADARAFDHAEFSGVPVVGDVEIVAQKIVAIEPPVDVHRAAEKPRALRAAVDVSERLERPQQHGRRGAFGLRDHVHAVIDAVDEIDVRMTRRPKHRLRARRQAFRRVSGEIVRPKIGFDFDDASDALHTTRGMNEAFAQKLVCDGDGVAIVERPVKLGAYNRLPAFPRAVRNVME